MAPPTSGPSPAPNTIAIEASIEVAPRRPSPPRSTIAAIPAETTMPTATPTSSRATISAATVSATVKSAADTKAIKIPGMTTRLRP
nr:hypothetical protein [Nocardia cyriacigeorgica]